MKFTGIIAMAKNRVIGKDNKLPWYYKEDLKFFKEKTTGGQVIMGRKTYEGMGVPHLKNRLIWVLMKENTYGWLQLLSPRESPMAPYGEPLVNILTSIYDLPNGDYFVAGGLSVYQHIMPHISEFFVTYINKDYEGDTVMPEFEKSFPNSETIKTTPDFEIKRLWK
jgi:dihydrofolate reductase